MAFALGTNEITEGHFTTGAEARAVIEAMGWDVLLASSWLHFLKK